MPDSRLPRVHRSNAESRRPQPQALQVADLVLDLLQVQPATWHAVAASHLDATDLEGDRAEPDSRRDHAAEWTSGDPSRPGEAGSACNRDAGCDHPALRSQASRAEPRHTERSAPGARHPRTAHPARQAAACGEKRTTATDTPAWDLLHDGPPLRARDRDPRQSRHEPSLIVHLR